MPKYFFNATVNAHKQATYMFDFVWPTAAAMWNLRWQVNGYLQIVPTCTNEQLEARFVEGANIKGANLRRACIEHTWDQQKESFAGLLLVNSIALFESWIDDVLDDLGKNTKTINKALQFPDSTATAGKGALWAIAEITNVESSELKTAFYSALTSGHYYSISKLDEMLLCYRYFKELRNCYMHQGGISNQKLIDAYNSFSSIATPSKLGVKEVPMHYIPSIDTVTRLSLRGTVGFVGILLKIIITLDAELSRAKMSEKSFIEKWKAANPHIVTLSYTPKTRVKKINGMLERAQLPAPSDHVKFADWLKQLRLIHV